MGGESIIGNSRPVVTQVAVLVSIAALFVSWQYFGSRYSLPPIWVFACFLLLEMLICILRGIPVFTFGPTLDNVFMGAIQRVTAALFPLISFGLYVTLYESSRLIEIPLGGTLTLGYAVLAYDFAFYWAHRASHQVNLLWAAHIVHHQSEEFNLSVAFRQGPFQSSFYFFFYLPLAVIGIEPAVFLSASVVHQLWQFIVHERVDESLGGVESVLITPSTHGLHHAVNDIYLDKNFGGILSVWDRVFGTFVRQQPGVEPRYGILRPLGSWNPIAAVLNPWVELASLSLRSRSLGELARIWFGRPAFLYEGLAKSTPPQRAAAAGPERLWVYLLAHLLLPGMLFMMLVARGGVMTTTTQLMILAFLLSTLYCAGALQDGTRTAASAETARLVALAALGWAGLIGSASFPGLGSVLSVPGDERVIEWSIAIACSGFALASLLWMQRSYEPRD